MSATIRKRGKIRSLRFWNSDGEEKKVFARVFDAKQPVNFKLKLDGYLIVTSDKGVPWNCLLARGAKRHAKDFPHKVLEAFAIGSAIYVQSAPVTRAGQVPTFIKYRHNFTHALRKFDNFSRNRFLNVFGDQGVEVEFVPPPPPRAARSPRDPAKLQLGPRQPALPGFEKTVRRGAYRRALDAGLIFETRAA